MPVWERMYCEFILNLEESCRHYHQRSNVESPSFMIKLRQVQDSRPMVVEEASRLPHPFESVVRRVKRRVRVTTRLRS